jgi:hypothetical protein
MTVKWEVVKRNVSALIETRRTFSQTIPEDFLAMLPAILEGKEPRALRDEWYAMAQKLVAEWDVRMCRKLLQAFPSAISPAYRPDMRIEAYMADNANCDWMLSIEKGTST